jgi:hypothetical protein
VYSSKILNFFFIILVNLGLVICDASLLPSALLHNINRSFRCPVSATAERYALSILIYFNKFIITYLPDTTRMPSEDPF